MNMVDYIEQLPTVQDGSIVSRKIEVTAERRVIGFAMAAGQELTSHTSPMHVTLVVVDGEADVELDGRVTHLAAGDRIELPANVPHAVSARADLRFLLDMRAVST
jgi:quercetin dioxygenase-like cupin family protein